ncbi:MAG: hypothetical protein GY937_22950 [bacterium]|nr:hypothetical protein [bacterium]
MRKRKPILPVDTLDRDGAVSLNPEVHPGLSGAPDYETMAEYLGDEIVSHLIERRDTYTWPSGSDGPLGAAQTVKQRIALLEHQAKHTNSARQVTMNLSGDSPVSMAVGKRNMARHWLDAAVFCLRAYLDSLGLQDKETLREIDEREERERQAAKDKEERRQEKQAEAMAAAQSHDELFKKEADAEVDTTPRPGETQGERNRRVAGEMADAINDKVAGADVSVEIHTEPGEEAPA